MGDNKRSLEKCKYTCLREKYPLVHLQSEIIMWLYSSLQACEGGCKCIGEKGEQV